MLINIVDLKGTLGAKQDLESDASLSLPDLAFEGPTHVHLTLTNAGTRLILHGRMNGTVLLTCARCTEPFGQALDAEIEEEFLPSTSPEAATDKQTPFSDLNVYDPDDVYIDLTEILRQNALASLPMQPLCKEDCTGLCPICGENRNRRSCDCKEDSVDPRLQGLLDIQAKLGESR